MLECIRCGESYEALVGRGRQSPYCPDCRARRRRIMAGIRQLRHTNTTINEWIEALGPIILDWKEDLSDRQERRCLNCGSLASRLYFAFPADAVDPTPEQLIGLCAGCHADWTTERRKRT